MALGTPTSAATNVALGGVSSGNITVTAPSGSRVYIAVTGPTSTARTVSSVSGGGLTWAKATPSVSATAGFIELWSADNPSGITSQSITVTFSGAILAGAMVAWYQTGVATSSPLDTAGATYTSTAGSSPYSVGPITTTNANDTVYVAVGADNASANTSTPSGTVINELFDYHSPNDIHLAVNWVTLSATQSVTGTGAWSAGGFWDGGLIIAYKEASAGTGATVNAVPALSTGSAPIAVIDSGGGASVAGVTAVSAGSAPAAAPTAGVDVTAAVADSVGSAPPANQIVSMVINAPAVVSLGSAPAAVIEAGGLGASVTGVPALSAGSTPIPVLSNDSIHTAAVADSAGSAPIAALGSGANVNATPALSVGVAPRPQIDPAPPAGSGTGKVAATFAEGT